MGKARWEGEEFDGAKIALFLGAHLVVILRDDDPTIPYPSFWDLPGGGREGCESPQACALRECEEELALTIPQHAFCWERGFDGPKGQTWFFVARLPASAVDMIALGAEGQKWCLMSVDEFLMHPRVVPRFQARLRIAKASGAIKEGQVF